MVVSHEKTHQLADRLFALVRAEVLLRAQEESSHGDAVIDALTALVLAAGNHIVACWDPSCHGAVIERVHLQLEHAVASLAAKVREMQGGVT